MNCLNISKQITISITNYTTPTLYFNTTIPLNENMAISCKWSCIIWPRVWLDFTLALRFFEIRQLSISTPLANNGTRVTSHNKIYLSSWPRPFQSLCYFHGLYAWFVSCQGHLNNEHEDDWLKSDIPGEMGGEWEIGVKWVNWFGVTSLSEQKINGKTWQKRKTNKCF